MEPVIFQDMALEGHDVLFFYNYQDLELPDLAVLQNYKEIHLVAWSMGVWVAASCMAERANTFSTATAIGGTLQPIDAKQGIAPEFFYSMVNACNRNAVHAFHESMFDLEAEKERFLTLPRERSIASICKELQQLASLYHQMGPGSDIFTQKIVTSRDRIFPARNQMRAWGKHNSNVIKICHFPFYTWGGLLPLQTKQDASR